MSMCEAPAGPTHRDPARGGPATNVLRTRDGRQTVPAERFRQRSEETRHGFQYVGSPEGMARPGAVVHDKACAARGADLPAAGRGRRALEGDPGGRGVEKEGACRGAVEHVHAAILA